MLQINHRLEHWKMGYRIWRDHVFFGVGIENISRFSGEYRGEIIRSWGQYTHPDKIHNAFIDNFVTGGIFVGFAWLIFVIYTFFVISKLLKATNLHSRKQSIYVLVSIWLTYLVQTLFSTDHMYLMTIGMLASGALIGIYIHEVKSLARSNFAKISN
jgi:O-antigen ligase